MPDNTVKLQCDNCSATDYTSCHFTAGGLNLCDACYRCVAAAKKAAQPPNPREQMLLADWLKPQPRHAP
jgi:hypothetical protein